MQVQIATFRPVRVVVAAFALSMPTVAWAQTGDQPVTLTVKYELGGCKIPSVPSVQPLKMRTFVSSTDTTSGVRFIPIPTGTSSVTATFQVTPGLYSIVAILTPSAQADDSFPCTTASGEHILVMPNLPAFADVAVLPIVRDSVPYSYIAGALEEGITLHALISRNKIACDAVIDPARLDSLVVRPAKGAYSVELPGYLIKDEYGAAPSILLEIENAGSRALVLIPLKLASGVGELTYSRFDATMAILREYASREERVHCVTS